MSVCPAYAQCTSRSPMPIMMFEFDPAMYLAIFHLLNSNNSSHYWHFKTSQIQLWLNLVPIAPPSSTHPVIVDNPRLLTIRFRPGPTHTKWTVASFSSFSFIFLTTNKCFYLIFRSSSTTLTRYYRSTQRRQGSRPSTSFFLHFL
jgi:hypothetical protein